MRKKSKFMITLQKDYVFILFNFMFFFSWPHRREIKKMLLAGNGLTNENRITIIQYFEDQELLEL